MGPVSCSSIICQNVIPFLQKVKHLLKDDFHDHTFDHEKQMKSKMKKKEKVLQEKMIFSFILRSGSLAPYTPLYINNNWFGVYKGIVYLQYRKFVSSFPLT